MENGCGFRPSTKEEDSDRLFKILELVCAIAERLGMGTCEFCSCLDPEDGKRHDYDCVCHEDNQ